MATVDGRVLDLDPNGYGRIETAAGKIVLFTLSQVKNSAGVSVGSAGLSHMLLGEPVKVKIKAIDGDLWRANSVTLADAGKWTSAFLAAKPFGSS